jgi:vacuolar protein sorting-associated protein 35
MSGTEDDYNQTRYLDAAKKVVKEQAFYMKRSMDGDKLEVAFEHAIEMLRELKTDLLSPKSYYELYMKVQEELRELEDYLSTLQRAGRNISEDYENVQSCVHVLPRLYLLCCVGGVYITSLEAPCKDILTDMVEIIKGIQHPMRGLFLRNYLTQVTKNRLPDAGTVFEPKLTGCG